MLVLGALSAVAVTAGCTHSAKNDAAASTPTPTPARSSGSPIGSARSSSSPPRSHVNSSDKPKMSVVPSVKTRTLPPVPINSPAAFGGGVSARVTKVADQKQTDQGPGVVAGAPAVAFTLEFTNNSGKPISVNTVNVTATYGHGSPAVPANQSSNEPLRNDVKAGGTAKGVYAFVIPKADRARVALAVWYAQGKPTVVFSGAVS